jgi:hypothetical protein
VQARHDAAAAALAGRAPLDPASAAFGALLPIDGGVDRDWLDRAGAACAAIDDARAAQAALPAAVHERDLAVSAARLAVEHADAAVRAVARARPRAIGGVALGAGGVLIIHTLGLPLAFDTFPVVAALSLLGALRDARGAARMAADIERRRLAYARRADRVALDRYEEDRIAWLDGLAAVRAADTLAAAALAAWHAIAGDRDPEEAAALIAAREHGEYACASLAWHETRRTLELLGPDDDSPVQPLVLCDPLAAATPAQHRELVDLLAALRPPTAVTYIAAHPVDAVAR